MWGKTEQIVGKPQNQKVCHKEKGLPVGVACERMRTREAEIPAPPDEDSGRKDHFRIKDKVLKTKSGRNT